MVLLINQRLQEKERKNLVLPAEGWARCQSPEGGYNTGQNASSLYFAFPKMMRPSASGLRSIHFEQNHALSHWK